jgi:hypothetical protein
MNLKALILKIPSVSCSDSINPLDIIVNYSDQNNDHEVNNLHDNVNLKVDYVRDYIEVNVVFQPFCKF